MQIHIHVKHLYKIILYRKFLRMNVVHLGTFLQTFLRVLYRTDFAEQMTQQMITQPKVWTQLNLFLIILNLNTRRLIIKKEKKFIGFYICLQNIWEVFNYKPVDQNVQDE